jgi:hypothetical protein
MEIQKFDDNCFIVRIRPDSKVIRGSLYEAAQRCWKANLTRAKKAAYVLVVEGSDSRVKAVYKPEYWYPLSDEFCKKEKEKCKDEYGADTQLCQIRRRIAFKGVEITGAVKYKDRTIPAKYFPGQNPVRYTYDYDE